MLTVVEVGIFASRFALRVEERNMFSVVPLLFLAFSLWLARGLPRPLVLTAVAALAPAALLLTLPLGRLLNIGVLSDTFGFIPLYRLVLRPDIGVDTVRLLMLGGGIAAALAFALLPRKLARVALPSAVALVLVLASVAVFDSIRDHSRATLALTGAKDPSWIDEEIGSGSRGCVSLRSRRRSLRRGADPLADGVLEPECRERLQARPAGARAAVGGRRGPRPGYRTHRAGADPVESDQVRRRSELRAARR